MDRCDRCPMADPAAPCPSAGYPAYCRHVAREADQPFGYWTLRLLEEAGTPRAVGPIPAPPDPPAPTLAGRAASLAAAIVGHALDLGRAAPPAVQAERAALCAACPLWEAARDACKHCGCGQSPALSAAGLSLATKRSWASSRCPLAPPRWGPV